jgi:hypothetical protein
LPPGARRSRATAARTAAGRPAAAARPPGRGRFAAPAGRWQGRRVLADHSLRAVLRPLRRCECRASVGTATRDVSVIALGRECSTGWPTIRWMLPPALVRMRAAYRRIATGCLTLVRAYFAYLLALVTLRALQWSCCGHCCHVVVIAVMLWSFHSPDRCHGPCATAFGRRRPTPWVSRHSPHSSP